MKGPRLKPLEQETFAMAALAYRYDPAEGPAPVTPSQMLMLRRREDRNDDLWTTFTAAKKTRFKVGS